MKKIVAWLLTAVVLVGGLPISAYAENALSAELIEQASQELQDGPVILAQPVPDVASIGEKATLSVAVEGKGISYTWYFRNTPTSPFSKSSLTGSTYTLTVTKTNINREVYCVITDALGNRVTTETVRLVQEADKPVILAQPVPSAAAIGEKANLTVEAKGEGLTYAWYFRNTPTSPFSKSSLTGSTYTLTVSKTNINREVYCVITDAFGNQVTTETVRLVQEAEKPVILSQPVPSTATIGEKASLTVKAEGTGLTYQWYYRNTPTGALSKSTITGSTYTLTVSSTNINRELYCVITDAFGNRVTTETVRLVQEAEKPVILSQPVPSAAAIGEKASVSVEAKGAGLTYTWYFRNTPSAPFSKSTLTGSTYTLTVSKTNINRELYCVITDAFGNRVTTELVRLVASAEEQGSVTYYQTLTDALLGRAGSSSADGAAVMAEQKEGKTVVTLLQSLALEETVTVPSNHVLCLNGYELISSASPSVIVKESAVIDGSKEGSRISAENVSAPFVLIRVEGSCEMKGGTYAVSAKNVKTTYGIYAVSGATLTAPDLVVRVLDRAYGVVVGVYGEKNSTLLIADSDILVTTESSLDNIGVYSKGNAVLENCSVISESDYTGANGAYTSLSRGVLFEGVMTMRDCYVWGAHSGITAKGALTIHGGVYEGYGHGGIYFAGAGTTSYVYNATVRWAEMREGTVADSVAGTNGAGFYIGGANNVKVYMDGCSVYATLYGVVLRDSGGEKGNDLFISNTVFTGCSRYAFRNYHSYSKAVVMVYDGVGNDYSAITGTVYTWSSRYEKTDVSYALADKKEN